MDAYLQKWFNPLVAPRPIVDPSIWDRSEYTRGSGGGAPAIFWGYRARI